MDKVQERINRYLNGKDWREKENANQSFCFTSFLNTISGGNIADYCFSSVYNDKDGQRLVDFHKQGKVHIHDLSHGIIGYCSGWSLGTLLNEGIPSIQNNIKANPAKHFRTAIDQMTNFIMILANEWAGAMAFSDVDIYLAPYIYNDFKSIKDSILKQLKIDGLVSESNIRNIEEFVNNMARKEIEKEVRQSIQSLLFNLNYPSRYGNQPPFSNFTLALTIPDDMKDRPVLIAGELLKDKDGNNTTYSDYIEWVDFFNKIFFEEMNKGDASGRIFTFPVITINATEEFFNTEFSAKEAIYENFKRFGGPYVTNQINGIMSKEKRMSTSDTRSMCCRLMMDLDELRAHSGGLFGNGESTGSLGVVSIGLPALAYESEGNWEVFLNLIQEAMDLASKGLMKKRDKVIEMYERGLMPYTKYYLKGKFKTYFNTIGYVGLNEALEIMGIKNGVSNKEEGIPAAERVLDFMLEFSQALQKQHGLLFNLEATPAEGASYRMAKAMKKTYPGIKLSGSDQVPMLTNSCHPSPDQQGDLFELIENQNHLQKYHSGGTIVHFYIGEDLTNTPDEIIEKLLKNICFNTNIPYFSLTTVFSVCPICGYHGEKIEYCTNNHSEYDLQKYGVDVEGEIKIPCEIYARVVGYYQSMSKYNEGKVEEFKNREYINISEKETNIEK